MLCYGKAVGSFGIHAGRFGTSAHGISDLELQSASIEEHQVWSIARVKRKQLM